MSGALRSAQRISHGALHDAYFPNHMIQNSQLACFQHLLEKIQQEGRSPEDYVFRLSRLTFGEQHGFTEFRAEAVQEFNDIPYPLMRLVTEVERPVKPSLAARPDPARRPADEIHKEFPFLW